MNNADKPAMPQSGTEGAGGCLNSSEDWGGKGLTKLEHFAGLAMQAMISSKYYGEFADYSDNMADGVAVKAIEHAKALLQQLEGGEDE